MVGMVGMVVALVAGRLSIAVAKATAEPTANDAIGAWVAEATKVLREVRVRPSTAKRGCVVASVYADFGIKNHRAVVGISKRFWRIIEGLVIELGIVRIV